MADRLSQVISLWRTAGPRAVVLALGRRTKAIVGVRGTLKELRAIGALEQAVARVTADGVKAGDLIFAMQKPREILAFLREAADPAPQVVVEIGTAAAGVLYLLSRIADSDALLISIDLPGGRFGGGYAAWRKPVYRRLGLPGQRIVLLRGSSHDAAVRAKVDSLLGDRQIDLLFIDGDHSLAGVRSDLSHFGARVRKGGRIALHDISSNPADPGVEVPILWKELSQLPRSVEFIDPSPPPGYGIGLLVRGDSESSFDVTSWPGAD